MRTLLLHNPTAGDGSLSADSLETALSRSGCLVTACSKHDDSYKAAFDETWDLVAVAGGDGTVAKAARHMPNRNVPFALLPTGTANNVAHSLDLLGEAEEIAANLQGAPTRPPTSDRSKAMGRTQFHRGCRPRSLRSCDHPLPRAG